MFNFLKTNSAARLLSLPLACLATLAARGQGGVPKADARAVVQAGPARFTVLTPQLIRLEWSATGRFEDRASFAVVNRQTPVPRFSSRTNGNVLEIQTDSLLLRYQQGAAFGPRNLEITFRVRGREQVWRPGMADDQNLKGTARTLDGLTAGRNWEGQPLELEPGLLSRSGWHLLDDSRNFLLDGSAWSWVVPRADSTTQDWYFFGYGRNYKAVLKAYTTVGGRIPLLPRFALGYWWSRYWLYSDQELRGLVRDFRQYDIPLDVLIIDMDWHETFGGLTTPGKPQLDETGNWLGWTGYTWNRAYFPDPAQFLRWTDEQQLKTALNLHPASGIAPMEAAYARFAQAYGADTTARHYLPYRMEEKKWASAYFEQVLQPLERQGVDFWWLDWQQKAESKVIPGLSHTWWLNHTFFTDMQRRGQKRPLLFHRWGGLGNHRYQIGFSGDDKIDWGSLKYQTYFTPTASNVGYGYWSHDIGGHASSALDGNAELYVRWLQFGVFSPILRTHSAKISSIERRFWKYPEQFATMKDLIHLRYSLAPYLYTAGRTAYDEGVSICRPMYYEHPEQEQAYQAPHQYYFGNDLLVAPVSDPADAQTKLATRDIWLPAGQWYEWHSGSIVAGGQTIHRAFALDEIPLYAKLGSVIPMYPKIPNLQGRLAHLVLAVVPGSGATELYEDDGTTDAYQGGAFAKTRIQHRQDGDQVVLRVEPARGKYQGMPSKRGYTIRLLHQFPPRTVQVNGTHYPYSASARPGTWTYAGDQLAVEIHVQEVSVRKALTVEVALEPALQGKENLLAGKVLQFRRIGKLMQDLKVEVARKNWWAFLPNEVLRAETAPTRITYAPMQILPILAQFEQDYPALLRGIQQHPDARPEVSRALVAYLRYD